MLTRQLADQEEHDFQTLRKNSDWARVLEEHDFPHAASAAEACSNNRTPQLCRISLRRLGPFFLAARQNCVAIFRENPALFDQIVYSFCVASEIVFAA